MLLFLIIAVSRGNKGTGTGELGDFDLDAGEWGVGSGGRESNPRPLNEDLVDESTFDAMARKQRRRERDEHHRQRHLGQARRLNEKRTTTAWNPVK